MFTFISLTYNHEKYILEHLESIKYLITQFGNSLKINFIFIDDFSKDNTVNIVKKWIDTNTILFYEIKMILNNKNQGINSSYLKGLKKVKTKSYKVLSGDDIYYKNNIFDIMINDSDFVISPIILFDGFVYSIKKLSHQTKNITRVKKYLAKKNIFPAPGIFFDKGLIDKEDYECYLTQFRNLEDYPTWVYVFLIHDFKVNFMRVNLPYVIYRSKVGISGNPNYDSFAKKSYYADQKKIKEIISDLSIQNEAGNINKFLIPHNYVNKLVYLLNKYLTKNKMFYSIQAKSNPYKKHHNHIIKCVQEYLEK